MPRVALMLAMVSVGVAAAFAYFGREAEGGSVPQATGMAALMNPSISAGASQRLGAFLVDLAPGDGRVRPRDTPTTHGRGARASAMWIAQERAAASSDPCPGERGYRGRRRHR